MNLFPIAASDLDVIIGIVAVVGWILAQIFSKKKNDVSPQEESQPGTGAPIDPRDELRKFFDELEKAAKPPAPTPVTPPPLQPKPHREKPSRRNHELKPETRSSQNRPVYPGAEPARLYPEMAAQSNFSRALTTPTQSPSRPELRDPMALRKLIIANEILGKPIALRQGGGGTN